MSYKSFIEKLGITPAPWECDGAYLTGKDFKVGEYIVDVHPFGMPNKTYEQFADVRVIETAPELLERDIKFLHAVESMKEKYKKLGDTGSFSIISEVMQNFSFKPDIKATGKSWEEIKELI